MGLWYSGEAAAWDINTQHWNAWFKPKLCFQLQLSANAHPGRKQVTAQVLETLSCMWET